MTKLSQLSLEEKAALLSGRFQKTTLPVARLDLPALRFSDGPHGVRAEDPQGDSLGGISDSLPATCFPPAATSACSWDPELLYRMGVALAEECRHYGIHVLLGPAVNIKRNPLAGRNFEYFSEDPHITSELGTAVSKGIQSQGVGVSLKHFAANNSENYRFTGNSIVDIRALREIYLKGFEQIVKKSQPTTLMCAYNQINGVFCAQNKWLLSDVLREEWGFEGLVMTDWGATTEREKDLAAGLDLEMPGMVPQNVSRVVDAVKAGTLSTEALDAAVTNLLRLIERVYREEQQPCDFAANADLAAEIACKSAVLMKNENAALPLSKNKRYLVIGDLFRFMRYQGSGSSLINPAFLRTPEDQFRQQGVDYDYIRGYRESEIDLETEYLNEALEKAKDAENILLFLGQTDYVESEGFDRESMTLPKNQLALIKEVIKLGKRPIVVLFGGSPVELPFADDCVAILNMMLPGQMGGEATYKLLFGEENPSGKLAETWPLRYKDVPYGDSFSKNPLEFYRESIFVGYRYYETVNKKVRFPFGHGLSYTNFSYSDPIVEKHDQNYIVSLDLSNTGAVDGAEIVQLYVSAPKSNVFKPVRELRAFQRVSLKAGESKRVKLSLPEAELRYYHPLLKRWVLEPGLYKFQLATSSSDIRLVVDVEMAGEDVPHPYSAEISAAYRNPAQISDAQFEELLATPLPQYEMGKRPYTYETAIGEFDSFFGKIIRKILVGMGTKQYKKALKLPDSTEREREKKAGLFIAKMMPSNSLRSLCYSSSGALSYPLSLLLLDFANGRPLRGLTRLFTARMGDSEKRNGPQHLKPSQ